jgi:UDP-N-acetylmuramate dehydrogenase
MSALAHFEHRLLRDEPLGKYTAARMGGNADAVYVARNQDSTDELVEVIQSAWADGLSVRVIGGGANILVSDKGVRGLVVVNRVTDIQFGDWHDGRSVSATGGTGLLALSRECAKRGLMGMEWAIGVPGTVGGAIVNNAGAHGDDMSKSVADVVVLEPSGVTLMTNAQLQYQYRYSALKARDDKRFIVLLATFVLPYGSTPMIHDKMDELNAYRKNTQPSGASLGSVFKNPPNDYAGRLIETSGLKGHTIGTAQVSPVHANFFLNVGEANAQDYLALIEHVRETVYRQHQVELELEIELFGEW